MKVTIVILNYNGLSETLECLESLKSLNKDSLKIIKIVVDNGSKDGSINVLSKIKDIKLLENSENLGFTGGNNLGIQKALDLKSDYILVLNNDTLVEPDLLINLIKAAKYAPIVCPKIYFAKGFEFHKDRYKKSELGKVIWYAGGKIDWKNIIGVHDGVDQVDKGQYSKRRYIDMASGACFLAKKEVFEKIGLFDEKYFLYLEDMDFCVRAKIAGFKIIFEPAAIVWHKNAASSGGSGSSLQDYFISRNRLIFAFRYAKLKTKLAVFRQILSKISNKAKRKAIIDFVTSNLGKGSISFG